MEAERIICDTDVMIDYWNINNPRHAVTKNTLDNIVGIDNIVLSAVTQMELLVGAVNKEELNYISKKLTRFNIALINDAVTNSAVQLLHDYNLSYGLVIPDALIAATSLETSLMLFTYNVKDYKFIRRLKLYSLSQV